MPKKMCGSANFFFGIFPEKLYDIYENSLFFCMGNRQPEVGLSNLIPLVCLALSYEVVVQYVCFRKMFSAA